MTRREKKKKKNTILILVLVLILAGGAFCAYKILNDKKGNGDNNKVEVPEKKPEPVKKLQIVDEDSTSRPYAVMVNNISVARPLQSGLQDAYLVYEIIVEGGITRYMALFMDQDTERIGSIRSARHYFIDYALENDAFYVHHGQSTQALSDFKKLPIDRIVVDNNVTGWRDKSLRVSSEHTLFTNTDKLEKGIKKRRTTRKGGLLLNYSIDEIDLSENEDAIVANNVNIRYSSSTKTGYVYDSENKVYLRSVNGKEHKDYVTKEQYKVKNIITYKVKNYTLNDPEKKGRQGLNNIGSGEGYYISNGYAVPITWEKSSRSAKTIYKLKNGDVLRVNDGNTFIQIQPMNQTLEIS